MSPAPRGKRNRGGLGKYLRAGGKRGGRPAEFGKRLVLEDEQEGADDGVDEEEGSHGENKYAKRQLGTNADRYEEIEVDPHEEQKPEPEVDLSSFLARQRLSTLAAFPSHEEQDDDVDHTLSNLPSASSSISKNTETIEWDAAMDDLKREKDAAEAIWGTSLNGASYLSDILPSTDLKSRFRKNQPRLAASTPGTSAHHKSRAPSTIEDSRHMYKHQGPGAADKADMEDFLDELLL